MGKIREYQFVTGIETSTIPDPGTPSAANDTVSLGYLNDMSYWAAPVDAYADMRALDDEQRVDQQRRVVEGPQETWYFDETSTSTDDGATVLKPDDLGALDPGRWLIDSSGGGGGGGGGSSGIEQVSQKAEIEKSGVFTEALDNSLYTSGAPRFIDSVTGRLLKNTASGVSSLEIVWNPIFVNDSDKDFDVTTNWTATGAGASLTTNNTTKQIGSDSLSFDKNNTAAEAAIRYDRGSQNLGLGSNTEAFFYINLPSTTNLTNVVFRVYKDSTSNYRTYTKITDISGNAFIVGWNLIKVDLVNDSGTNTGSGWTYSDLSRYVEIGVTATIGQTYTAILVDSLMFSISKPQELGLTGQEITIYDTSNRESVIIDSANTRYAGRLTLAANTTNAFNGGYTVSTAAGIQRITMAMENYQVGFDSSLSSGNIATTQELRLSRKVRESISGSAITLLDVATPQLAKVVTVGGSTIEIDDPSDLSADYASGNTVDVIRPMYTDGEVSYKHISTKTLSAGSSHSSGLTTLTLTVSGILVGDLIVKKSFTTSISVVDENDNEAFTTATLDSSPNGIQILDNSLNYPYRDKVIGHFSLGGSLAMNNIAPNPILTLNNNGTSPNPNASFLYGRLGTTGFASGTNYYIIPSALSSYFDGTARMIISFWFYGVANNGTTYGYMSNFSSPTTGWGISRDASANNLTLFQQGTTTSIPYNVGKWNHCLVHLLDGTCYTIVNGVKSSVLTSNITGLSQNLIFGNVHTGLGTGLTNSDIMADMVFWSGSQEFTVDQAQSIYRSGNYVPFNVGAVRYRTVDTGVSGQKLSTKDVATRTTTGVTPVILKKVMSVS